LYIDELDQALDAEVGERQDAVFSGVIDQTHRLRFPSRRRRPQPVFVFAELLGDAGDIADNPLRAAAERFGAKLALSIRSGTQIVPLKMPRSETDRRLTRAVSNDAPVLPRAGRR
jgi:hypothetical protein